MLQGGDEGEPHRVVGDGELGRVTVEGKHPPVRDRGIHVASGRPGSRAVSCEDAGPKSIGRNRRSLPRNMSKQTLVAIRYSHVRSVDRPSNRS